MRAFHHYISITSALVLSLLIGACGHRAAVPDDQLVLDCRTIFTPEVSAEDLVRRFGASQVEAADIHLGEGEYERGTVLFPGDPLRRIEITWKDADRQKQPDSVRAGEGAKKWRTPEGVSVGSDLQSVERLNGVVFELAGFDWDYAGSVMSWKGGRLESAYTPCRLVARFRPRSPAAAAELSGDRAFASSHPAMQRLNPVTYELMLLYPPHE